MDFLKDYDINFRYHPRKANVVADALSRGPYPTLNSLLALPRELDKEFKKLEINVVTRGIRSMLYTMETQSKFIEGNMDCLGHGPTFG